MATNGIVIEFGIDHKPGDAENASLGRLIGTAGGLKAEGAIEEFRFYGIVTGNRTQRMAMMILEVSNEQLEALVLNDVYINMVEDLMDIGSNVTTNRAITLERLQQMMADRD
jgi:hypothetical protein